MRFFALFLFVFAASLTVVSQQSGTGTVARNEGVKPSSVTTDSDKEAFEKAIALEDPFERIDALKAFIGEFRDSELRTRALESLSSARAAAADIKLRAKDPVAAVNLFRLAVDEAPDPISDDLFSRVLVNIPINLFVLEQLDSAFEIANILEARSSSNPKQLIRLATFYFSIKYATGARRLAEKARDISPEDPLVYQSLGAAYRLGFDLNSSVDAYEKALQLEPDSLSIRQYLAEMKRATGYPADAEVLFKEILEKKPGDIEANTGLILSLFDQGRKDEAKLLLADELERNAANVFLLTGVAHWYAANGEPDLAIENAIAAVNLDQSAVWAYIAMGRAFMKKGDPVNAEKSLLAAASLAPLPTVAYELALARVASGFYRDASDVLKKFFVLENGQLVTDLDGRIGVEADNFADLISLERKTILFTPVNGYEPARDAELKALLTFESVVEKENTTGVELEAASNSFIGADDAMKTHRQLYVAAKILDAGKSPDKAAQIAREAIDGVETSIEIAMPAAAVMADQLFEGRQAAAAEGRMIVVPPVEKSTLIRIMRGRIEELAARSYMASGDLPTAQIRLKRAIAVLPADSAWWRSSMWRLGKVYESSGDNRNALTSYAASYSSGDQTLEKRNLIEALYQRVNGSLTGLDALLATKQSDETDAASRFIKGGTAKSAPVGDTQANKVPDSLPEDADSKGVSDTTELAEDLDLSLPEQTKVASPQTVAVTEPDLPEDVDLKLANQLKVSNQLSSEDEKADKNPDTVSPDKTNEVEAAATNDTPVETAVETDDINEVHVETTATNETPVETAAVNEATAEKLFIAEMHVSQETTLDGTPFAKTDPAVTEVEETALDDAPVVKEEPAVTEVEETVLDDTPVVRADPAVTEVEETALDDTPAAKEEPAVTEVEETALDDTPVVRADPAVTEVEETALDDTPVVRADPAVTEVEETALDDTPVVRADPAVTEVEETALDETPAAKEEPAVTEVEETTLDETQATKVPDVPTAEPILEPALKIDEEEKTAEALTEEPGGVSGADPVEPLKDTESKTEENESSISPPSETETLDDLSATDLIDLGATRPRFVAPEKIRVKPEECSVVVSQESLSIISNGGSLGLVVGVTNYDQAYVMRVKSSSPEDISITYEPEIGSIDGRAFFVIKSVSERTGIYNVSFQTPCGNKSVVVEVH